MLFVHTYTILYIEGKALARHNNRQWDCPRETEAVAAKASKGLESYLTSKWVQTERQDRIMETINEIRDKWAKQLLSINSDKTLAYIAGYVLQMLVTHGKLSDKTMEQVKQEVDQHKL